MKNNWFLTDDDSCQYVKEINPDTFELIEMGLVSHNPELYEVYADTINLNDYFYNNGKEGLLEVQNILKGFGYSSLINLIAQYPNNYKQIMAECIFEHYGSFQANQLANELTYSKAKEFIKNYIKEE